MSLTLDTQIIPLYHNTPNQTSVNPGDLSSLMFFEEFQPGGG
jgi:hypothetical protein